MNCLFNQTLDYVLELQIILHYEEEILITSIIAVPESTSSCKGQKIIWSFANSDPVVTMCISSQKQNIELLIASATFITEGKTAIIWKFLSIPPHKQLTFQSYRIADRLVSAALGPARIERPLLGDHMYNMTILRHTKVHRVYCTTVKVSTHYTVVHFNFTERNDLTWCGPLCCTREWNWNLNTSPPTVLPDLKSLIFPIELQLCGFHPTQEE